LTDALLRGDKKGGIESFKILVRGFIFFYLCAAIPTGPVVQWIEWRFPEPQIQVRSLSGLPLKVTTPGSAAFRGFLLAFRFSPDQSDLPYLRGRFRLSKNMSDPDFSTRGLIFDLDGVVVDTTIYHYRAWRRMARQLGFDLSPEQHRTLHGCDRMTCLEKILQWGQIYISDAEKLHWSDVKNNWYVDLISRMGPEEVLPGVLPFLQEAKNRNIRTALVSSSSNAGKVLESTRLMEWFEVLIDGNMIKKSKPHPERYLLAAAAMNLGAPSCIVFEDSSDGIKAGKTGGFRVVGVGPGPLLDEADFRISGFGQVSVKEILHHFNIPVSHVPVS
jgi:beta-phosphoglucomutase